MNGLKSCPFCGGEAEMGENKQSTVRAYFVGCMNCHIRLYKIGYKRFYTEAEAIAAWNRRAERTCRDVSVDSSKQFYCSECECTVDVPLLWGKVNYCPNCGCKVVK